MPSKYQRRHYEDFARVLHDQRGLSSPGGVSQTDVWYALTRLEDQLVELFEDDNPQFHADRFRRAAGWSVPDTGLYGKGAGSVRR